VTPAEDRQSWKATIGMTLAEAVAPSAGLGGTRGRVPGVFTWWGDDDVLVAAGYPKALQRHLDEALAYGIAEAGDRELLLVLPSARTGPTRLRLPWVDAPVRLFGFDGGGPPLPVAPLAQAEALADYDDPLVTHDHDLGEMTVWVERLVAWAESIPELVAAHRSSYLAWHCRGRKVVGIRRSRIGLTITAGIHSSKAESPPLSEPISGPIPPTVFHRVTSAASAAIADRLAGIDVGNAEHQLQERVAQERRRLGLRQVVREFPAVRPVGQRGFIDFLAVGRDRRLHVVETKIGPDPMLVLQGLDYWIWASAHRSELAAHLTEKFEADIDLEKPPVIDFVIGAKDGQYQHPITASVVSALDGAIRWRFHTVDHWDRPDAAIASLPTRRTLPDSPPVTRYADRLQRHLLEAAGPSAVGVHFAVKGAGIVPDAQAAYDDLVERGLAHRHVDHVRSSQAFALNLFAGLDDGQLAALWALVDPQVTDELDLSFEYSDPDDGLGEAQSARPRQTQVDVVLRGRTTKGQRRAAFIEVKLSETAFGACSAFESERNDTRSQCRLPGPWGGDPNNCFQLRNHDTAPRRRYDTHLLPDWVAATAAQACEFLDLNQPMRNRGPRPRPPRSRRGGHRGVRALRPGQEPERLAPMDPSQVRLRRRPRRHPRRSPRRPRASGAHPRTSVTARSALSAHRHLMGAFDTDWWDARCVVNGRIDTNGVPWEGAHHVGWIRWRLIDELLQRHYLDIGLKPGFGLLGSELYNVALWSPTCRRAPRYFGRLCGVDVHPEADSGLVASSGVTGLRWANTGAADLLYGGVWATWSAYLRDAIATLGLAEAGVVGHENCFHRRGKASTPLVFRIAVLLRTGGGRALIDGDNRMLTLAADQNGAPARNAPAIDIIRACGDTIPGGPPRFVAVELGDDRWVALRTDGWAATPTGPVDIGALWRGGATPEQIADTITEAN